MAFTVKKRSSRVWRLSPSQANDSPLVRGAEWTELGLKKKYCVVLVWNCIKYFFNLVLVEYSFTLAQWYLDLV